MPSRRIRPHLRLFLLATVLFVVGIGVVRLTAERLSDVREAASERTAAYQRQTKTAYERSTTSVLDQFSAGAAEGPEARLAAVTRARDELLALTVPVEYKDLHLNLVIALGQLEAGYRGEPEKLEAGQVMLRETVAPYAWLARRPP